jgi:hypothetical protein
MVVTGIVRDYNYLLPGMGTGFPQHFQESPKSIRVKFVFHSAVDEFTVAESNCTEITNTASSWFMHYNRIRIFWGNPHTTPGTMLLKVNFIECP